MRYFLAVDVDESLLSRISEFVKEMKGLDLDVKFVESRNLHFTINFLGDLKESEVNELKKSLVFLSKERDFKISISGMGYFGSEKYIRTLWMGVKEGKDSFIRLMKVVNENVKLGKPNLSPHMTIGRVKSPKNRNLLLDFMRKHANVKIGEMNVKGVKLKSSRLTGSGPIYEDVAVFDLCREDS